MHSRRSKRQQLIIRTVVSTVMTTAVVGLSIILLFLMLGYRFNKDQGTITQGGLVQFITTPPGARVTVGSAQLANITPSKITLIPGTYGVSMERNGYHTWKKTITIKAGTVTWLNSARLVPTQIKTDGLIDYTTVSSAQFSPKARFLALLADASKPVLQLDTIDRKVVTKTTQLELPAGSYSPGTSHEFTIEKWGRAEHYLLVKHVVDGHTEWVVVDTQDVNRSYLIGAQGAAQPIDVLFDLRTTAAVIVRYSDGTMRHIQTQTGAITQYPLQNIATFSFINDQAIAYTTTPVNGTVSVGYYSLDATASRPLTSYTTTAPVYASGSEYFKTIYYATAHDNQLTIYTIGDLPRSDSSEKWNPKLTQTIPLPDAPTSLVPHANGRLFVATHGTSQLSYDLELDTHYDVPVLTPEKTLTKPQEWFDDFNFWNNSNGMVRMYEFDGTNPHDIVATAPNTPGIFSDDNKYLYTIGKTDAGYRLQVSTMIIE